MLCDVEPQELCKVASPAACEPSLWSYALVAAGVAAGVLLMLPCLWCARRRVRKGTVSHVAGGLRETARGEAPGGLRERWNAYVRRPACDTPAWPWCELRRRFACCCRRKESSSKARRAGSHCFQGSWEGLGSPEDTNRVIAGGLRLSSCCFMLCQVLDRRQSDEAKGSWLVSEPVEAETGTPVSIASPRPSRSDAVEP